MRGSTLEPYDDLHVSPARTPNPASSFDPTSLVSDVDLHLLAEGRHLSLHHHLGAHLCSVDGADGVAFTAWAPAAQAVSVVGDWNHWVAGTDPLTRIHGSEVWATFVPHAREGHRYKLAVTGPSGATVDHADPLAFRSEPAPNTASIVHRSHHQWSDQAWMEDRDRRQPWTSPMSTYEVHLGSWRRDPADPHRELSYRELAPELAAYVADMGFTHVELMPVMQHPFAGSWGYQVTSYFAPVARWGEPDDLRFLAYDNLYACDNSVFPASPAANPSLNRIYLSN